MLLLDPKHFHLKHSPQVLPLRLRPRVWLRSPMPQLRKKGFLRVSLAFQVLSLRFPLLQRLLG